MAASTRAKPRIPATSPTIPKWGGRRAMAARAWLAESLPASCARGCGTVVQTYDQMRLGHRQDRVTHPELTWEPSNWQVECVPCSDRGGQRAVQAAAGRRALVAAGLDPDTAPPPAPRPPEAPRRARRATPAATKSQKPDGFFDVPSSATPLPRPVSLSPAPSPATKAPPRATNSDSGPSGGLVVPPRLAWGAEWRLQDYAWLEDLAEVPENAGVPLAMTPVHPDAVGSYGPDAVAWFERTQRLSLRWWQKLAICRQLEHNAAGELVWRTVVESASRRVGKSVRLRAVALWRLAHGQELFGEPQLIIHTGKDVAIVREIQQKAWRWAEDGMAWTVTRANGKEALETQTGDRWLARAMHSVYGYDVSLGMVDEGWGVDPAAVDEGLEPATLERPSPQVHLTSTAHRKASSLMRRRISDALSVQDGETLLMLWAAPAGADPGDLATWRAASPHWSEDRRKTLASRYEKAMAGEVDPEADDLDPMAGFTAQYLNQWTLKRTTVVAGEPVVSEQAWDGLRRAAPAAVPAALAVEGWPGQGLSVVRAWADPSGTVTVRTDDVHDVKAAAELARQSGARQLLVGASLAGDPAWRGLRTTEKTSAVRTSVADFAGLLRDKTLRHDGSEHLSGQVLALRTSPGADGLRVRSTGRADAVKAAVWAAQAARTRPTAGRLRIVGPDD